ncbi:MAG: hypothetical protein ACFFAU_14470 [Candidatus Hodarchaeota archaeon]
MIDSERKNDSYYKNLLNRTIQILNYDEKRERLLHEQLSKSEVIKTYYRGYIIKTQYSKPDQEIDLVCFRQMSDVIELYRIEPELKELDCFELLGTIKNQLDYLFSANRDFSKLVAILVTLVTNNTVNWLIENKYILQDSKINQIWVFREKKIGRSKPFRFNPKHLDLDYLILALKKIERGENWEENYFSAL